MADSKSTLESTWALIERYIAPYRGAFFKDNATDGVSVDWRRPWVYDSTATMGSETLASSLHSSLTSPSLRWFDLKFRNEQLNESQEALEWLEECGNQVYHAIQDSNFNVQVNETYQDCVNYGTGILICEEDEKKGLVFHSVQVDEAVFEVDEFQMPMGFYRKLEYTANQLLEKFGEEGLTDEINRFLSDENHDATRKFEVLYCIFRRHDISAHADIGAAKGPLDRPYGWKYITFNTGETLGKEGGFYEMPAFIPRWRTTTGSVWGNGPAHKALSDTLTLNRTIELNLARVEKEIDPPMMTTQRGVIGDLDMSAGGLTVVRDINALAPFLSQGNMQVVYEEMNRLRENIDSYFFVPQLVLPPMQGSPATATEITVRLEQLERLVGPTLGRMQHDLLNPTITRAFRILLRGNKLPPVPDIVSELGGQADIEYTGPMAKTQEASQVQALERLSLFVGNWAQVNPEALDKIDIDQVITKAAHLMGVPAKVLKPQDEVDTLRQQRQAAQQAQAQGEAMQAQGEGQQAMQAAQQGPVQ